MNNAKPTLLFVCVHNAGRSQLAAGLAASRGGDQVNVLSAGLDPDDKVSEVALASLAEVGTDRSDQTHGVRYETWPLPDPAEWDIDGIRPLRDYIDAKVQQLLTELPEPRRA
jgi:arsenate reductase (thioredoxin)